MHQRRATVVGTLCVLSCVALIRCSLPPRAAPDSSCKHPMQHPVVEHVTPLIPSTLRALRTAVPLFFAADSVLLHILVAPDGHFSIDESCDTSRCSPANKAVLDSLLAPLSVPCCADDTLLVSVPLLIRRIDTAYVAAVMGLAQTQSAPTRPGSVSDLLRRHLLDLFRAYRTRAQQVSLSGDRIALRFEVASSGEVQNCELAESQLGDTVLERQIVAIATSWRFNENPRARSPAKVTLVTFLGVCID